MLRMPSLLESRSDLLHLRTPLGWKRIQPKNIQIKTGAKRSEASEHFHQWRWDAFSIENYVIKKGRPRGARHGKTEAQEEHFIAHNGIHDRFQRDPVYRDSQLKIGWTEETCIAMDKLAQESHSYCPLSDGKLVYHTEQIRKKCTNETPIRLPRSTYKYAPSPPWIWRRATWTKFPFINTKGGIRRLLHPVPHGGSGMNTGGAHKLKIDNDLWAHAMSGLKDQGDMFWCSLIKKLRVEYLTRFFNLLQPDRLQLIAICCNRRGVWTAHLTRHIFSCFTAHISMSHRHWLKFGVRARLCGFALAFDRLAKARAFDFNAKLSNCISEVSCSLLSFPLLLLKSVTNLFKPWEILTHEWELSLFTDSILISTPYFPCKSNLSGQKIFHVLAKCTHDKSLNL